MKFHTNRIAPHPVEKLIQSTSPYSNNHMTENGMQFMLDTHLDDYYNSILHENIDDIDELEKLADNYLSYDMMYDEIYGNVTQPKKNAKKIIELEKCNSCVESTLVEDTVNGIVLCGGCGKKLYDMMDACLDWLHHSDDNRKVATTGYTTINTLLPNASMASVIRGKCSGSIRTIHARSYMIYEERRMSNFFKIIHEKCEESGLVKIIEDDMRIFLNNLIKVEEHECKNLKFRASNLLGIFQGCMYFACKKNNYPLTPKEISEIWETDMSCTTKGIKDFAKFAKTKGIVDIEQTMVPDQFIKRFCKKLGLKPQYMNDALKIAKNVEKLQIAIEHAPVSIASGSIFLVLHINKLIMTRKALAEKIGVSIMTVTKTFRKFLPFKKILLNDGVCNQLQKMVDEYKKDITVSDKITPNFIRFSVTPPIDGVFNVLKIIDGKYYIKNTMMNRIVDETDKLIARNNYYLKCTQEFIKKINERNDEKEKAKTTSNSRIICEKDDDCNKNAICCK